MIRPPEYTAAKFKGLLRTMNRILILLASLLVVGNALAGKTNEPLNYSRLNGSF